MGLVTCSSLGWKTHSDKDCLAVDSYNTLCHWMVSAGQYTFKMITLRKQTYQFTYSHIQKVPLPTGGLSPTLVLTNERIYMSEHMGHPSGLNHSFGIVCVCVDSKATSENVNTLNTCYCCTVWMSRAYSSILQEQRKNANMPCWCWRRNEHVEDLRFLHRWLWWLLRVAS